MTSQKKASFFHLAHKGVIQIKKENTRYFVRFLPLLTGFHKFSGKRAPAQEQFD